CVALHHVGQLDAAGGGWVAQHTERIVARRDLLHLREETLAHHGDADIARAQMLFAAVGDGTLPDPGNNVLVDDMAVDPASAGILDRADPGRDDALNERLAALPHPQQEPG